MARRVPALKEKVIEDLVSDLIGTHPIYNDKTKDGRRLKWYCPHARKEEIILALRKYKGVKVRKSTISTSRLGQYGRTDECITVLIDLSPWKKKDVEKAVAKDNSFLKIRKG